jgi:5-methylcytosine-specific restriction endonuclease McrA
MQNPLSSEQRNIVFSRAVPATLRAEALDHSEFNCHKCGLAPGEIDSTTGRKARLHVGYIIEKNLGGKEQLSNLWAICSICIQGSKGITLEKPTVPWLLSQIEQTGQGEQRETLRWLREKFKE